MGWLVSLQMRRLAVSGAGPQPGHLASLAALPSVSIPGPQRVGFTVGHTQIRLAHFSLQAPHVHTLPTALPHN